MKTTSYELQFALGQVEKLKRIAHHVDNWRLREALEFWQKQVERHSK